MLAFAERYIPTRWDVDCGWNVRGGRGLVDWVSFR